MGHKTADETRVHDCPSLYTAGRRQVSQVAILPRELWTNALRQDAWLYLIVASYCVAVLVTACVRGQSERLTFFLYVPTWMLGFLVAFTFQLCVFHLLPILRSSESGRPLQALARRLRRGPAQQWVAAIPLFVAIAIFYGAFTTAKNLLPQVAVFSWDQKLAAVDRLLHFGTDPWKIVHPLLGHHAITRTIEIAYSFAWFVLIFCFTAWAALLPRERTLRKRFFVTYLICWIGLGNLLAMLFSSAGPAYFGQLSAGANPYTSLLDYLGFSVGRLHSARVYQEYLWEYYRQGTTALGTGISAFPSVHVAMATLFTVAAYEANRRVGWFMCGFLLIIFAGSIHLGWHYAVDGYASMLLVTLTWKVLGRLFPESAANVTQQTRAK